MKDECENEKGSGRGVGNILIFSSCLPISFEITIAFKTIQLGQSWIYKYSTPNLPIRVLALPLSIWQRNSFVKDILGKSLVCTHQSTTIANCHWAFTIVTNWTNEMTISVHKASPPRRPLDFKSGNHQISIRFQLKMKAFVLIWYMIMYIWCV